MLPFIAENSASIDHIKLSVRQIVNYKNPNQYSFTNLKNIREWKIENGKICINRPGLKAKVFYARTTFIESIVHLNGNDLLRSYYPLPPHLAGMRSEDSTEKDPRFNFIPIGSYPAELGRHNFFHSIAPRAINEIANAQFLKMVSHGGGVIEQMSKGKATVSLKANDRSYCVQSVEGGYDVQVVKDFDVSAMWFRDNLAANAIVTQAPWLPYRGDKLPYAFVGGFVRKGNIPFVIYFKCKSHPKLDLLRIELRFEDRDRLKLLNKKSFRIDVKPEHTKSVGHKFITLLTSHALPFAKNIMQYTQQPSFADKGVQLMRLVQQCVRRKNGYAFTREQYSELVDHMMRNNLLVDRKTFSGKPITRALIASGLFFETSIRDPLIFDKSKFLQEINNE